MTKKEEKKEPTYDFTEEKTIEQKVDEKINRHETKRLEHEDIHILDIQKNPPEPGYMNVDLKKAKLKTKDDDEEPIDIDVVALPLKDKYTEPPKDNPLIFINTNGESIEIYDPIIDIDLKQVFDSQVSDCASVIFPMLMDEYLRVAVEEKKAWQPEKRKEEFKWWWVLLLMMIIIPIILITITVFPSLMGG